MKKNLPCWLCCVLLLLCVPALAEEATAERILAAENDRLALYLDAGLCSIDVEDKLTGKTWSSTMNDETAEGLKIIPAQQKKITSLLAVNCTNLQTGLGVVNNLALMAEKDLQASYELIENGVRLTYYLGTYQVGVSAEITLDGATLLARVPYTSIREDGDFSLVSVDMLPYLFSATDKAEGFFFYPDGCGAVMEFQDNAHYKESTRLYPVYGDYQKQPALLDMFAQEAPQVLTTSSASTSCSPISSIAGRLTISASPTAPSRSTTRTTSKRITSSGCCSWRKKTRITAPWPGYGGIICWTEAF